MLSSRKLDPQLIEQIINKAKGYTHMSNAFTVDAAFSKAATEFLGDKNSQWGAYKKSAKEIFLHRQKELKETKQKELLKGAQEAALARRDAEIEEDEGIEERLSELRSHYKNISR